MPGVGLLQLRPDHDIPRDDIYGRRVSASTSYSYRVRATDAAGNITGYSTVVSATTQGREGGTGSSSLLSDK